MEDLNTFEPAFSTPVVDPQFFTAVPSEDTPMDRLMSVFTAPKEALQGIELEKSASAWLVPLLVALLLTAASFSVRYLVTDAAEVEHQMKVQVNMNLAQNKNMSAEQRKGFLKAAQDDVADPNKSAMWGLVTGFATPLLATLFSCLIFFLLAKTVFKADHVTYKMLMTAGAITLIISGVGDVVGLMLQAITGNGTMSPSLAAFVHGNPQEPLFVLAMQFNIFKIWELAVFSMAFASLVRKQPAAGYAAVFTTWMIRVVGWTGIMAFIQKMSSGK